MISYLVGLQRISLVLLLDRLVDLLSDLIRNMANMRAALGCADAVDEADLIETVRLLLKVTTCSLILPVGTGHGFPRRRQLPTCRRAFHTL